ncbi:MAG: leucyl aminopeptidase family protein [Parvularcula sp.]
MSSPLIPLAPFDQARAQAAARLVMVEKGGTLPDGAEPVAARMGFDGALGQLLPDEKGALIGVGQGEEPLALGAASAKLSAGDYIVDGDLSANDALGWALGAYKFSGYKDVATPPTLVLPDGMKSQPLFSMVEAAYLVRDLINTPAEDMGPDELVAAAAALASRFGADISVLDEEAVEEGFPLVHAVGRAAARSPRLIDLRWGNPAHPAVTLVGKGVCFDSGGLDIKRAAGMALMKKDMGGAANALGLALMIMAAGLPLRLRVLIPAVENAISGNAFRPGDIFRSRNGTTVEISNTDAEGRLILADALSYAAEEEPSRIISLATLTGAARVALGPDLSPTYSTDAGFLQKVVKQGGELADPCWPMPFWGRYDSYLSSRIADVNHASPNSFAGSITAALFLKRFVPDAISYTHFDIFGWVPKARPGRPVGGEAMAIRALFGVLAAESFHGE